MRRETMLATALLLSVVAAFGAPADQRQRSPNHGTSTLWGPDGLFGRWTPADEVVSLRTECSKTFNNHDGTYSLVLAGPVHRLGQNGEWEELSEPAAAAVRRVRESTQQFSLWGSAVRSGGDSGAYGDGTDSYDTVRVGTNPGYDPIIWAAGYPYFRVQFIYLSSELQFNGHIVGLGFFGDGQAVGGDTINRARHWLKDVSYSTFNSDNWSDPGEPVWGEGTLYLPEDSNWVRLQLHQPYTHIHGNNLLVSYWHKDGTVERAQWYRFHELAADRGKRGRDNTDSIPPMIRIRTRPNIEIVYIPIYPDMQTVAVLGPKDTVVSGQTYTPQAVVRNNGPVPAVRFEVKLDISTGYSKTRSYADWPVNSQQTLSFDNWTAATLGSFVTRCSVRLNYDSVPANNRIEVEGFVRRLDVQVVELVSPPATVDSGQEHLPSAIVRNNGNTTVSFDVRYIIEGGYTRTQRVTELAPDQERLVVFDPWTAQSRGTRAARCTTLLAGDQNQSNNRLARNVFVRVIDAASVVITSPPEEIDSGQLCVPQAVVRNNGNTTTSFGVRFDIGGYSDTRTITLGPGAQTSVAFAGWTAPRRGSFTTRCTTLLAGDMAADNNSLDGLVRVAVHDVGVVGFLAPCRQISCGPVVPEVRLRNYGTTRGPVEVMLEINSNPRYFSRLVCPEGLPLAEDTVVTFAEWLALPGSYVVRCSVFMEQDQVSANDTLSMALEVKTVDLAVTALVAPVGQVETAAVVVPAARVTNLGGQAASFEAWFRIDSMGEPVYSRSMLVQGLGEGRETLLVFDTWPKPHPYGMYSTVCSVYVANDQQPGNDLLTGWFFVVKHALRYGWRGRADIPVLPSNRPASKGAWLAADCAAELIYGSKGNKSREIYAYDPDADNWRQLAPVPAGREGRPFGKGAAGCCDGQGLLYVTKGGNTSGFWRYDTRTDSWQQLADVPLGTTRLKVKDGSGLVFVPAGAAKGSGRAGIGELEQLDVGAGFVYLLKGQKGEFFRYNTANDSWETGLAPAPNQTGKWAAGSWLVTDGTASIFAHQAKSHALYRYDLEADSWTSAVAGMPLLSRWTGKAKKSKDGGCATWLDRSVYCLKGGNTQEFWEYRPAQDSWYELDTIPAVGTTMKRRRVKAGAAIVGLRGLVYALKGNKTTEFWMYVFPPEGRARSGSVLSEGVAVRGLTDNQPGSFTVGPNPLIGGGLRISCQRERVEPVTVRVLDLAGRVQLAQTVRLRASGSLDLDMRRLGSGVYLVQLVSPGRTMSAKVVVQR